MIPARDQQAITDAVLMLMDDNELCDRLGEEARNHIMVNFPVSSMISNIQSYIDEMITSKNIN